MCKLDFGLGILRTALRYQLRLVVALCETVGYFIVFLLEISWYIAHGQREMIGRAIGDLGREVVDAFADVTKQH